MLIFIVAFRFKTKILHISITVVLLTCALLLIIIFLVLNLSTQYFVDLKNSFFLNLNQIFVIIAHWSLYVLSIIKP